jgi:uncharacterized protein
MANKPVVNTIKKYLKELEEGGIKSPFAVLYGSYFSGTQSEWSDIDIIVVSESYDRPLTREDISSLWKVSARIDSRIEPIPCGLRQWETDDSSAIIETARLAGETIWAA